MTIAICYSCPEGVVLGADSTTMYVGGEMPQFFNHTQKLFEVGEQATLGLVSWGMAELGSKSHRTMVALLADDLVANPAPNVAGACTQWIEQFWTEFSTLDDVRRCQDLSVKQRTPSEELEFEQLCDQLEVGFCLAGYLSGSRSPEASEVVFRPLDPKPTQRILACPSINGWGAPAMMQRLMHGFDSRLVGDIIQSGHWKGSPEDLKDLMYRYAVDMDRTIPIRDAIDFVHTCIYSSIKALKFSPAQRTCGGPIEIAVITSDRKFRWVLHKEWDSAIGDRKP